MDLSNVRKMSPLDKNRLNADCYNVYYCKFGNFPENFIFANSVNRHTCNVKKSRTMHDLPISVNDE